MRFLEEKAVLNKVTYRKVDFSDVEFNEDSEYYNDVCKICELGPGETSGNNTRMCPANPEHSLYNDFSSQVEDTKDCANEDGSHWIKIDIKKYNRKPLTIKKKSCN